MVFFSLNIVEFLPKQNYQIDIKGPYILVYIHNVEYCPYKIQIAVDIIDSLSNKLNGLNL